MYLLSAVSSVLLGVLIVTDLPLDSLLYRCNGTPRTGRLSDLMIVSNRSPLVIYLQLLTHHNTVLFVLLSTSIISSDIPNIPFR